LRALLAIVLFALISTVAAHRAWGQVEIIRTGSAFAPIVRLNTTFYQVRIDQRVIIRLPSQAVAPANAAAGRKQAAAIRYKEEKIGKCLWIDKLAGSQPGPNRTLDIATRDGVLIRAYLGDGCLAREFYAGAYLERPYDGKLCVDRDMLHARTGAKCEVDKFRLLVPR
jgi:hypothetical protein